MIPSVGSVVFSRRTKRVTFSRIRIQNFQSLHDVDLELGKLTVVVGASNSGKSALLRALRTLMQNAPSPSFVTHGKSVSVIATDFEEGYTLALERGKALATYRVTHPAPDTAVDEYPKSGTKLPDVLRSLVRPLEEEGQLLQYAGQFDRPYLLDAPTTKVAQVLGELTNIVILHDAVREANRRRLERSSKLKVRTKDRDELKEKVTKYHALPKRVARLTELKQSLELAKQVEASRDRLGLLVNQLALAEMALDQLPPLQSFDKDMTTIDSLEEKLLKLRAVINALLTSHKAYSSAVAQVESDQSLIVSLQEEHDERLTALGVCPLCGQLINKEPAHSHG